jgi:probable phosphoglycerate mutase
VRTLYVVTHPEATHHLDGVVGGWFDSRLTELGMRQADAIAERLGQLLPPGGVPGLYSSDLTRAAQTADAIAQRLDIKPVLLSGLREKSYGAAEGLPESWLDEHFVPPPAAGDRMNHFEGVSGAETKHAFAARVYDAVEAILDDAVEHQIVVTHGFALTFVVAAWARLPLETTGYLSLRANSGSITVLSEDDYFHNRAILSLNETDHLARA